ncbi:MAG TPA: hypothetical protein VGQ55_04600 [Pyrinomonadaceae bacterium]|jgi:hypothetical protein|nr:hypothetical protein [Pyrinomonadaceae bacterium]
MSIAVLKRICGTTAARWAKNKGMSKLKFVLSYGLFFGLLVTALSRMALYLFDVYWFRESVVTIDEAQVIGSLFGTTLAGFYIGALVWEQLEKAEQKSVANG